MEQENFLKEALPLLNVIEVDEGGQGTQQKRFEQRQGVCRSRCLRGTPSRGGRWKVKQGKVKTWVQIS